AAENDGMSAAAANDFGRPPHQWLLGRLSASRHVILSFVVLFAIWELGVHLFDVPSYLLPAPSLVWTEFSTRWAYVLANTWVTASEIIVGYMVAVLVSVPLAIFVAYFPTMERSVYPIIVFLQIVPKIAIAPLFIIWFGFGFTPKVLLVFLLSFFPIVVASIAGFKSIDQETMELARSTGAGPWMIFRKIRLPSALPQIFTGLKVAAALASTAAVVAEFVASDKGLGYLLLRYNGDLETPMVFATIIVLSIVGLIVYYAVELIERLAIPWHVSQRNPSGGMQVTG
ncbi:MAG: ABC transporter permease, partial [Pseudomonadota bacterium]